MTSWTQPIRTRQCRIRFFIELNPDASERLLWQVLARAGTSSPQHLVLSLCWAPLLLKCPLAWRKAQSSCDPTRLPRRCRRSCGEPVPAFPAQPGALHQGGGPGRHPWSPSRTCSRRPAAASRQHACPRRAFYFSAALSASSATTCSSASLRPGGPQSVASASQWAPRVQTWW